jgi:ABC-type nitrate/sulfonate/bicarbonate transport system substrate-binding protein
MGTLITGGVSYAPLVIQGKDFDVQNGIDVELFSRVDISVYFSDFANQTYETTPLGPSTILTLHQQGAPIKVFAGGTLSTYSMWVTYDDSITEFADLEGKKVASPLGDTSLRMQALANQITGRPFEDLVDEVISAPGPVAPLQELAQDNVAAALSWEPAITSFELSSDRDVHRILNFGDLQEEVWGETLFTLIFAGWPSLVDERRDVARAFVRTLQDMNTFYTENPTEAAEVIAARSPNDLTTTKAVVERENIQFDHHTDTELRDKLETQWEAAVQSGIAEELPDESIYANLEL